jgi:SAM-dependent methyltransferase
MSGGRAKSEEADIEAIFTRLRAEVEGRVTAQGRVSDGAAGAYRTGSRSEAERLWPVTAERLLARPPGARGFLSHTVKKLLRKAMRWYVEPLAASQRQFNLVALRLIDEVAASTVSELDERVTRLERARRAPQGAPAPAHAPAPTAPAPVFAPMPDYFAFQARLRGSIDEIRERQARYVDDFREQAPVLDLGCGRGEFLRLLADEGIEARGVDIDPDMVAFCVGEGLDVEQGDGLAHLEGLPSGSLGGIFCAHVIEHLPPDRLVRLLELAADRLRPSGVLITETPNPRTLVALSTFFADLTHVQPVHPDTLTVLARQAGFARAEIRYTNEPPPEARLQSLQAGGKDAAVRQGLAVADDNFTRLNEVVFGPQDYALVART